MIYYTEVYSCIHRCTYYITVTVCIFVAIQPPLAPYVTEVITTPNSAIITWIATIVHDDETYTVYYGTDSMALENTIEGMGNASVPNEFSATINGLMPFTTYNYIVSAVNSEGTTNTSVMTFMTNETGMVMVMRLYNKMILLFVVHA